MRWETDREGEKTDVWNWNKNELFCVCARALFSIGNKLATAKQQSLFWQI